MIALNAQSQLKIDIIFKVYNGKITVKNAAKLLNKSTRTIERYLHEYKKRGLLFAIHQNSKMCPLNKIDDQIKLKVQSLIKKKYYDLNLTHLNEKLKCVESIDVKRETLRKWAHEINHVKRSKKRRGKVRKKRDRMEATGLMIQMDGSHHNWFGDKKSCLIAAIDDANSELDAEFFSTETTLGCMKVLKNLIEKKGSFKTLYVDRAGIFGGPKRCRFSQVKRACEELGIQIIFANSAEAKGRIERSFDTLQDRLIPELRLNKAQTMEKANKYLKERFIPEYWEQNITVEPIQKKSEFLKLDKKTKNNLDSIFTIKNYRKINGDHTFSMKGKVFAIKSKLKSSLKGYMIEIRTGLDGEDQYYFADEKLVVSRVVVPARASTKQIEARNRLEAAQLSKTLDSVSKASRETGISRQIIYRTLEYIEKNGKQHFMNSYKQGIVLNSPTKLALDRLVVDCSLVNPHLGEDQMSLLLKDEYDIEMSSGGVRNIWLRNGIQTIALRILASKEKWDEAA